MDPCTVETGLLRKKPCGHPSVTKCANCEQPLCSQHAVAQLTAEGKKSGKFMCQECHAARREYEKTMAALEHDKKSVAAPAAPPAKKPAAPAEDAPAEGKGGGSDDGGIDFTPGKK